MSDELTQAFERLTKLQKEVVNHYVERSEQEHKRTNGKSKLLTREKYIEQLKKDGVL